MIKFADIESALRNLIGGCFGEDFVASFESIEDAGVDYVWIRLRPSRRDLGFGLFERNIRVDFVISLVPDGFAMKNFGGLYEMADILDAATLHSIPVADRHITVYDSRAVIFDGILTYSFQLDFADYYNELPVNKRAEFMESLQISLNINNTHTSENNSEITIKTLDDYTQSDYNNTRKEVAEMTMKPRQMVKRLRENGFIKEKSPDGSHQNLYNPVTGRRTTVPMHSKELGKGLEQAILKQAGLKK